jgi:hypothetical protein
MPCTDKMKNKKYHNVGRIPQLKNGRRDKIDVLFVKLFST